MKNWALNLVATAGLILVFALTMPSPAARLAAGSPPAPQERHEGLEDLHRAQQLLQNARAVLMAAPGEYGGHRDKAIKRIDEALGEVHEALEHH